MTEFIRVRFEDSGTEQTIAKPRATPEGVKVLKEAATDSNGRPLPPKFPVKKQDKSTGQKADTKKES